MAENNENNNFYWVINCGTAIDIINGTTDENNNAIIGKAIIGKMIIGKGE